MTEPLEPAKRLVEEPTDDAGRLLGWRGRDVAPGEISGDEYAAQFPRHEPEG